MSRRLVSGARRLSIALCMASCGLELACAQALDSAAVEAFFDREWRSTLSDSGAVPGAIVTVVHDGTVVLNKGYGVSDIDTGQPADAQTTRIRIGSTSKLFAALAALALVDAGKLELDRDVNDYLTAVKVPDSYNEPITLRTLLSHRSGFDTGLSGYVSLDNDDIRIAPEVYQRRLIRHRPPNRVYGYDNLGVGLLGFLVGEVHGTSFARAVEDRVTRPLGLESTTVGVPDRELAKLAACHTWDSSGMPVKCAPKFMREGYQAAGDVTSTGVDMAHFMAALLNGSCLTGTCVLEPDTFRLFTDVDQHRMHPGALGLGFLIYERNIAGRLAIGHDGGQDGFSTALVLFPDTRTGVLVSLFSFVGIPEHWNLSTIVDRVIRGRLHNPYGNTTDVLERFAQEFLPERTAGPPRRRSDVAANLDLAFLAGNYVTTDIAGPMLLDRILRVATTLTVSVVGEDVRIKGVGPYRHTGGGVLEASGIDERWLFTRTDHDVVLQQADALPFEMHVKKPWHWHAGVTFLPLLLPILLAIPGLVFSAVKRRSRPSRRLGYCVAFAGGAVLAALYLELEHFAANYYPEGPTPALVMWRLLLNLGWLAALAVLYTIARNRKELVGVRSMGSFARSALVTLFALAAVIVAVLLPYWGFIGKLWGV